MPHSTIQLKGSPRVYESSVVKGHGFSWLQSMMELQEIPTTNRLIIGRVNFCNFKTWKWMHVYKISFITRSQSSFEYCKAGSEPGNKTVLNHLTIATIKYAYISTCCNFQCVDSNHAIYCKYAANYVILHLEIRLRKHGCQAYVGLIVLLNILLYILGENSTHYIWRWEKPSR